MKLAIRIVFSILLFGAYCAPVLASEQPVEQSIDALVADVLEQFQVPGAAVG